MRYDTEIFFQSITTGEYDPETGDYGADAISEVKKWANVTDSRTEFLKLQYGNLKEGNLIVRLQTHFSPPYDRVRIGDKLYKPVSVRDLRAKTTIILAEVGTVVEKKEVEPDGY